jgi:hypothetical protein
MIPMTMSKEIEANIRREIREKPVVGSFSAGMLLRELDATREQLVKIDVEARTLIKTLRELHLKLASYFAGGL